VTITLVILAVAVVFVLWRLSSVLGQDQGFIPQFDRESGGPERTEAATDEPASPQEPGMDCFTRVISSATLAMHSK